MTRNAKASAPSRPAPPSRARSPVPAVDPVTGTVPDAVRISGLSRSAIYRLAAAGELVLVKAGARTLVRLDSLRGYLAGLPAAKLRTPQ